MHKAGKAEDKIDRLFRDTGKVAAIIRDEFHIWSVEILSKFLQQFRMVVNNIKLPKTEQISRPPSATRSNLYRDLLGLHVGEDVSISIEPQRREDLRIAPFKTIQVFR